MGAVVRLLAKVSVSPSGCWEWTGARLKAGYGLFWYQNKLQTAHRSAFHMTNGEFPEVVMHTCDNPCCVNPQHLVGGTQKQNIADRDAKGRRSPNQHGGIVYGN